MPWLASDIPVRHPVGLLHHLVAAVISGSSIVLGIGCQLSLVECCLMSCIVCTMLVSSIDGDWITACFTASTSVDWDILFISFWVMYIAHGLVMYITHGLVIYLSYVMKEKTCFQPNVMRVIGGRLDRRNSPTLIKVNIITSDTVNRIQELSRHQPLLIETCGYLIAFYCSNSYAFASPSCSQAF